MSTISLVWTFKKEIFLFSLRNKNFNYLILPFDLVAKSATANLVLFNSVLVDAKIVFVVSKLFEVAE
jgi:hypothetical protein